MDFDQYQKTSRKTAIYPKIGKNFVYPVLGLVGETGEVADKIKKVIRDDGGILSEDKRRDIEKELGDVLWYIANLAIELDLSLDEIALKNLDKLKDRWDRGVLHGSGDNR